MKPGWLLPAAMLMFASQGAAGLTPEASVVYAQFLSELKLRSAQAAIECGIVENETAYDAALTCADQALSNGRSFWFAHRGMGVDSAVWMGVAHDGRGLLYRLYFDSDATGGTGAHPRPTLSKVKCSDKDVRDRRWPPPLAQGCDWTELIAPVRQGQR